MRIDGNGVADELPRQGSSHLPRGLEAALGISTKVAMGVISAWTNRKHKEHWQSICGRRQAKGFLKKKPYAKRAGKLLNLSRYQLKIIDRAANRTLSFKRIPI
jgi:hypothetical protein